MRIAIFAETFLPKWDGVANTLCYYLDYLGRHGHETLMFAPQGAPKQYAETPIKGLKSLSFPFYPSLKLVPPLFDLSDDLRVFRPQIIHLVNPATMSWMGLRHARQLHVPVVASYHTDIPGYAVRYGLPMLEEPLWSYFRSLHDKADLNYCPSTYTKQQLQDHGFQRLEVWSHGVDAERYSPQHRSAEWRHRLTDGHPQDTLLLYVGRLATEKRIHMLRPMLDALPDARLAIVGDGPERANLEALFQGTKTVFAGFLKGEALSAAYASADLFVFPSDSETFGNVTLEALASGLPVVAPKAGGQVDLVTDGHNGRLFETDSVADLVDAVCELVGDPARLAQMGQNARAFAERQSWDSVNEGAVHGYERLLSVQRHINNDRAIDVQARYVTNMHERLRQHTASLWRER